MAGGVEEKARRYLATGRVTVIEVSPETVQADVVGTGDRPYGVSWSGQRGWRCSCPAYGRCAHEVAVGMVTSPGGRDVEARPTSMPPMPPPPEAPLPVAESDLLADVPAGGDAR